MREELTFLWLRVHGAFYSVGAGGSFPGSKAAEADCWPASSAQIYVVINTAVAVQYVKQQTTVSRQQIGKRL
jgi:hypothetical protein